MLAYISLVDVGEALDSCWQGFVGGEAGDVLGGR